MKIEQRVKITAFPSQLTFITACINSFHHCSSNRRARQQKGLEIDIGIVVGSGVGFMVVIDRVVGME